MLDYRRGCGDVSVTCIISLAYDRFKEGRHSARMALGRGTMQLEKFFKPPTGHLPRAPRLQIPEANSFSGQPRKYAYPFTGLPTVGQPKL